MKSVAGKKGKGGVGNVVMTRLVAKYSTVSAAGAAITSVQALSPLGVQDFSSYAALYDLVRVKKVEVMVRLESGVLNGSLDYAVAFDPSNLGAYASVADVLTARHHVGPLIAYGTVSVGTASVNKTGFQRFTARLEQERVTNDGTAANAVGGGWIGTSDTTAVVGWLKPYVSAAGGAIVQTLFYYVVYDVEFKSRT